MQSKDLIRFGLELTRQGTLGLVEAMRSKPLTQPTSAGGNHPMWVMGHLAYIEGSLRAIIKGEANPVEKWASLFAPGSTPVTDPSKYPPFDEVVATFVRLRGETLAMLDAMDDATLDSKPASIPPGFEEAMATVGRTLTLISLHQMVHYGQITDARRAAGIAPMM
jgi:uncharacterized damage-inducible protein DinB